MIRTVVSPVILVLPLSIELCRPPLLSSIRSFAPYPSPPLHPPLLPLPLYPSLSSNPASTPSLKLSSVFFSFHSRLLCWCLFFSPFEWANKVWKYMNWHNKKQQIFSLNNCISMCSAPVTAVKVVLNGFFFCFFFHLLPELYKWQDFWVIGGGGCSFSSYAEWPTNSGSMWIGWVVLLLLLLVVLVVFEQLFHQELW